jgi:hypothetical protein
MKGGGGELIGSGGFAHRGGVLLVLLRVSCGVGDSK